MASAADLDHFTLTCHRFGDGWMFNVAAWNEDQILEHVEGGTLTGTLVPIGEKSLPTAVRIVLLTLADS